MKEKRLESCGLVFLYLTGRLEEGRGLSLRKIDSCQHLMDFSEQVRSLRAETAGRRTWSFSVFWDAAAAWIELRQQWDSRFRTIFRGF